MNEFIAKVKIRNLELAHIKKAVALSIAANWNQTLWDWSTLIHAPGNHLAAEFQGQLIGTTISLNYGAFSWIAMVLIHPGFRRRGIATLLLDKILINNPDAVYRLDATPDGAKVYEKLGFKQTDLIHRWHYNGARKIKLGADQPKHLNAGDLARIRTHDQIIFGADRTSILFALVDKYPNLVLIGTPSDTYLFGRFGRHAHQIGPIVATQWQEASILLQQLISLYPGQAFYLDSFAHIDWAGELQRLGFKKERELYRMQKNSTKSFGLVNQQFAITGPELG